MQRKAVVSNGETLFRNIYQLAKAGDLAGLNELAAASVSFKIHNGVDTPIMRLAREGNDAAVALVLQVAPIQDIEELKMDAMEGYARGGHVQSIAAAIASALVANRPLEVYGITMKALVGSAQNGVVDLTPPAHVAHAVNVLDEIKQYAMEGYAKGGQHELVWQEVAKVTFDDLPASNIVRSILKGYALSCDLDQIQQILLTLKERNLEDEFISLYVEDIVYYLAMGGWVDAVNDWMEADKQPGLVVQAAKGYAFGGHFSERQTLLRLLACTQDRGDAMYFCRKAVELNNQFRMSDMQKKSSEIRLIMKEYDLNYQEARVLLALDEAQLICLLQGAQMELPVDVYLHILTYTFGLDEKSVRKVHTAANQRLLADTTAAIKNQWLHKQLPLLFRRQDERKINELEALANLRGNFYNV